MFFNTCVLKHQLILHFFFLLQNLRIDHSIKVYDALLAKSLPYIPMSSRRIATGKGSWQPWQALRIGGNAVKHSICFANQILRIPGVWMWTEMWLERVDFYLGIVLYTKLKKQILNQKCKRSTFFFLLVFYTFYQEKILYIALQILYYLL